MGHLGQSIFEAIAPNELVKYKHIIRWSKSYEFQCLIDVEDALGVKQKRKTMHCEHAKLFLASAQ